MDALFLSVVFAYALEHLVRRLARQSVKGTATKETFQAALLSLSATTSSWRKTFFLFLTEKEDQNETYRAV